MGFTYPYYHSDSASGAVSRFLTAYLSESGNEPSHLALKTLTDHLDLVAVQKIMRDGTRRVLQISEVVGVDPNDRDKPLLNDLYRYEIDGDPDYDENGNVVKIHGHHKRVGKISDTLLRKFQLEGVAESQYDFLLKDPDNSEVETYTGEDIDRYGLKVKKQ